MIIQYVGSFEWETVRLIKEKESYFMIEVDMFLTFISGKFTFLIIPVGGVIANDTLFSWTPCYIFN